MKKQIPNIITLSRIPMLFIIVGLLCLHQQWTNTAAFILFIFAAVSDWLDGYLARKLGTVSNFGKLMDALTDKIIMVGLFVALLGLRWPLHEIVNSSFPVFSWAAPVASDRETLLPQFCVFCVMIIICREFFITGLRLVAASNGIVLAAEKAGKIKTAMQMTSVSLLLLARALASDGRLLSISDAYGELCRNLGLLCFYLAVILTIYSGIGYIIKNWKVFTFDEK